MASQLKGLKGQLKLARLARTTSTLSPTSSLESNNFKKLLMQQTRELKKLACADLMGGFMGGGGSGVSGNPLGVSQVFPQLLFTAKQL